MAEELDQHATRLHPDLKRGDALDAQAALRALPPIREIVAQLESLDVSVVELALAQLSQWVIASSTRETNAITAALGFAASPTAGDEHDDDDGSDDDDDADDDDGDDDEDSDDDDDDDNDADEGDDDGMMHARGALPPLDAAIERHLDALSPAVLARVFGALFQKTSDNFPVASRIARELAKRGDVASQCALVDAFVAANEYDDTGHRVYGNTVHGMLIDDVFPALASAARAKLVR